MGRNHPGLILVSLETDVKKGLHLECANSVPAMGRHHPGLQNVARNKRKLLLRRLHNRIVKTRPTARTIFKLVTLISSLLKS